MNFNVLRSIDDVRFNLESRMILDITWDVV